MFDHLEEMKEVGNFQIVPNADIALESNIPADVKGVILIWELARSGVEIVYIGHSDANDLRSKLLQSTNSNSSMAKKIEHNMKLFKSDGLDIYWYVCPDDSGTKSPEAMAQKALKIFKSLYGRLPKWNKLLDAKIAG